MYKKTEIEFHFLRTSQNIDIIHPNPSDVSFFFVSRLAHLEGDSREYMNE